MSNPLERFGKERREVGREESRRVGNDWSTTDFDDKTQRTQRKKGEWELYSSLVYCRFTVSYDAG